MIVEAKGSVPLSNRRQQRKDREPDIPVESMALPESVAALPELGRRHYRAENRYKPPACNMCTELRAKMVALEKLDPNTAANPTEVARTHPPVRYLKCKVCGHTWKDVMKAEETATAVGSDGNSIPT